MVTVAAMLALLVVHAIRLDEHAFSRSYATVNIMRLDHLEQVCAKGAGIPTFQSWSRAQRRAYRCGSVMTDRGNFALLPSGSLLPLGMTREDMVEVLREGNCYEIHWFGYQEDPVRGASYDPRQDNTIYWVRPLDGCPPSFELDALPVEAAVPWEPAPEGVHLHLRVGFMAPSYSIIGAEDVLHITVRATPERDRTRANEAVATFFAKQLALPRSAFSLVSGNAASRKVVLIRGDRDDLTRRLGALAP